MYCRALIRCLRNHIGVCFCPKGKTDATNLDTEPEKTRLMTVSLQWCLFPPFKDKLRVCLSNQRWKKKDMCAESLTRQWRMPGSSSLQTFCLLGRVLAVVCGIFDPSVGGLGLLLNPGPLCW